MSGDLTRWNRAGLKRFRYVDGNAATFLEDLRLSLLPRFLGEVAPQQTPLAGADPYDPEWWRGVFADPPAAGSGDRKILDGLLADVLAVLRWGGGPDGDAGPLWAELPVVAEFPGDHSARLLDRYGAARQDLAWEIVRAFARGVHLLGEHLDAYANEGFLGTAAEWESVRRLVAMLDVYPAPPASASTILALSAAPGRVGRLGKGFQVKHSPADGSAPLLFETLTDLDVDPALNELRPTGFNRNPAHLSGTSLLLAGAVKGLKIGEPLVVEDERSGTLHAHLIRGVHTGSAGGDTTRVDLAPPLGSGVPKGWAVIHAGPKDRLAPFGPTAKGATVARVLELAEIPLGLLVGEVVWISDGKQPLYRRVERIEGRRLIFKDPLGDLQIEQTVVGRPISVPISGLAWRDVEDAKLKDPQLASRLLAVKVAGDWSRLQGAWLADGAAGAVSTLPRFNVMSADFHPVGGKDPDPGYTHLRLEWKTPKPPRNPQALLAPPIGGGLWQADVFLQKTAGRLPRDLVVAKAPKQTAAGDLAVVASGGTAAWARLGAVALDEATGRATLSAAGLWEDRGGSPYFRASTTVYGHFEQSLRVAGWDSNVTPLSGKRVPLASPPGALRPGRLVFVGISSPSSQAGIGTTAQVVGFDGGVGASGGDAVVLSAPVPAGATYGNLVLSANAVVAGHGERRQEKVLGSGDAASSGQTFVLRESPVSFVADAGQPAGVRADLDVRVGDRIWHQVSSLGDSAPSDPHYTVRMTEDGQLELSFGDGVRGRRLPTGVNNVRVSYRVGAGISGNLAAGQLVKAARPNPLIAAIRQPLPATGGNDAEGVESLRASAPGSVATLDRAVSLEDFGRLAATQSSVWQARAFSRPTRLGRLESVRVAVVPAGGGALGGVAGAVRDFLLAHALPGVSVEVDSYQPIAFGLKVSLEVDTSEFDAAQVAGAVRGALLLNFGLRQRSLGQPLLLSQVYRVVEAVSGVANSVCTLDGDTLKARVEAPADGVVHLDAPGSSLVVTTAELTL